MRLTFAAKSGRDYTGIGALLVERGIFTRDQMSMQMIRKWMLGHPQEARELMRKNESFIFFRNVQLDDPALGALGAQHVQLTPQRSLAVDRSIWMFGTPIWLETEMPSGETGTLQPFRKLLIAQDTGTAIKGHARGDVFWGSGEAAGNVAGRMKSPGRMVVLLPIAVARRLELAP
jgi:membrane-bound lytic murein transglycosylase A